MLCTIIAHLSLNKKAHLYSVDEEPYDQRDENYISSDDDDNDTSHYCEVCDRDFPSKDVLLEHKNTHMVCGIDGCTFSAYPLLVEKHISMQHRTGLYHRMKDLSEDIEKWIMERKKRYPTEDNIKLRKAEELEKLQRGEIIKENSNVRMKTKKIVNTREKKRKPRKRRARETNNDVCNTKETYRGLRPFPGITILQEDNVACLDEQVEQTGLCEKIDNISDEDDVSQACTALEFTNISVINSPVLPTLVADYESEDNDEGPEEVPVKKIKVENQDKIIENTVYKKNSTQVYKQTSNIQSYTDANDKSNNKSLNTIAKRPDKQNRETNQILINKNERILHRYRNKLLEKLLSRSIQHERNLICQCVKYIIENNFFDLK